MSLESTKANQISAIEIACHEFAALDLSALNGAHESGTSVSPSILVAKSDSPAVEVANLVETQQHDLVFLFDETNLLKGFIEPDYIVKKVNEQLGVNETTLLGAISVLASKPRDEAKGFGHEWLNTPNTRLRLFWCERGNHCTSDPEFKCHPK